MVPEATSPRSSLQKAMHESKRARTITAWPRNVGTSSDWRAGYDATSGPAFGDGGTWRGRLRKLRALGLRGRLLKVAHSSKGAWRIAASPSLQTALGNAVLRRYAFWMPSDLASPCRSRLRSTAGCEQTARPVVWEGAGAQSPAPDPINATDGTVAPREDFDRCG